MTICEEILDAEIKELRTTGEYAKNHAARVDLLCEEYKNKLDRSYKTIEEQTEYAEGLQNEIKQYKLALSEGLSKVERVSNTFSITYPESDSVAGNRAIVVNIHERVCRAMGINSGEVRFI